MNRIKYSFIKGDIMLDKKQQLNEASREVFLEKGYKHTNISEITRRSTMSEGTKLWCKWN